MEKALLQFLRSLAQSGITDLPAGGQDVALQLEKSIEATREAVANDLAESTAASNPSASRESELRSPGPSTADPAEVSPAQITSKTKVDRLKVLNEKVQSCFACSELVSNRTQTVFGVGNPDSRLCFMGEAPGADEDVQGEPFVGAAGQLLNRIIIACKMQRDDVYILNTLKCRPPGNRNPSEEECARCRPFLDEQLKIIRPEYICCLGGIAAKHLLDTPLSVGRLRGKLHLYNGIKVVVTYHPAYLLRNPDAKKQVWEDMKFLMAEMGHDIT